MSRRASGGGIGALLLLAAVALFVLSAFGVDNIGTVSLFALGMAVFAASFVVP